MDKFQIRRIPAKSESKYRWCTGDIACDAPATYYLVRLPSNPLDRAESRSRRCEVHARDDAKALGIPFPEKGGENA